MPVASSAEWGDPRETPAKGCAQGRTLPPPSHPVWKSPPMLSAWHLGPEPAAVGGSWWPPPSPLTAGLLTAHAVMWQGTTTTRTNWLM